MEIILKTRAILHMTRPLSVLFMNQFSLPVPYLFLSRHNTLLANKTEGGTKVSRKRLAEQMVQYLDWRQSYILAQPRTPV